ncbi:MAG: xanthine phosphoribosyltransferase [Clostridia bacterium]
MQLLEDRITQDGKVYPGNVLKVDSFLNHQIDCDLMTQLGAEIVRRFDGENITKVLTVEASGIAFAFAVASLLGVPMVFAKKSQTNNLSPNVYNAKVVSYTHSTTYDVRVEKEFILPTDKVLIVDDFLANGAALTGLADIITQAGAKVVGCAIAIEKGFQDGGKIVRGQGIRVESLAIIEKMTNSSITFRN